MFEKYIGQPVEEMDSAELVEYVADLAPAVRRQFILYEMDNANREDVIEPLKEDLIIAEAPESGYYNALFFPRDGNLRRVFNDTEAMREELTELGLTIHEDPTLEIQ